MKIDLHIHTTGSDGRFTPIEIVNKAASLGMETIAITDHDSIEGIESALAEARKFPDLMVIPGVEMGATVAKGEMHILGYFVDHFSDDLRSSLEILRNSRTNRGKRMLSKLAEIGVHLNWGHVASIAADASIGRPHIAQALLERGFVSNMNEAFDKYIGSEGPAYVTREKMSPIETVSLIAKIGGLPVLAHPARTEDIDSTLSELRTAGLIGMEVYYKDYDQETKDRLKGIADKHGLICCGGSDYHGFEDAGNEIGRCDVPQETVDQLIALQKQRTTGSTS
ncbi:MAG: PHP domain-containing protein [Chloroflexota bacterium]|nr:PHP domain-containing protein [Chloroflexota bacterium]